MSADLFVMISGCSGGGKSTLLTELARRGFATVAEPGRRIIAQVRGGDGTALPWADLAGFARRALAMSIADHQEARGLTFFDRGVVDAAVALRASTRATAETEVARHRYHRVFLAPPWPEIYVTDDDRRHGLVKALGDYESRLPKLMLTPATTPPCCHARRSSAAPTSRWRGSPDTRCYNPDARLTARLWAGSAGDGYYPSQAGHQPRWSRRSSPCVS